MSTVARRRLIRDLKKMQVCQSVIYISESFLVRPSERGFCSSDPGRYNEVDGDNVWSGWDNLGGTCSQYVVYRLGLFCREARFNWK